MEESYVSIDIETDGPIPGSFSMLSIGMAAFSAKSKALEKSISCNLERLLGAEQEPDTLDFWARNQKAYEATRIDTIPPMDAMPALHKWLDTLSGKPVAVAYPAGFDFTFVHWYFHEFTGNDPFGFQCIDIKTYAMALMKTPFKDTVKANMPKAWFEGLAKPKHTHNAVDDAIEQGVLFMNMLNS